MIRLGIVVAKFNPEITSKMHKAALIEAKAQKATVASVVFVPGVFEIPLAVKKLLKRKEIDAVVTLGAVITGGTDHDQVIANATATKLLALQLEFEKPVSLGILGPRISWKQSALRAIPYSQRAVDAACSMVKMKV